MFSQARSVITNCHSLFSFFLHTQDAKRVNFCSSESRRDARCAALGRFVAVFVSVSHRDSRPLPRRSALRAYLKSVSKSAADAALKYRNNGYRIYIHNYYYIHRSNAVSGKRDACLICESMLDDSSSPWSPFGHPKPPLLSHLPSVPYVVRNVVRVAEQDITHLPYRDGKER